MQHISYTPYSCQRTLHSAQTLSTWAITHIGARKYQTVHPPCADGLYHTVVPENIKQRTHLVQIGYTKKLPQDTKQLPENIKQCTHLVLLMPRLATVPTESEMLETPATMEP